ncbi:MAG: hypothetical protein ACKPKO_45050, partial [Candidatus Fonsibacter sp.]
GCRVVTAIEAATDLDVAAFKGEGCNARECSYSKTSEPSSSWCIKSGRTTWSKTAQLSASGVEAAYGDSSASITTRQFH